MEPDSNRCLDALFSPRMNLAHSLSHTHTHTRALALSGLCAWVRLDTHTRRYFSSVRSGASWFNNAGVYIHHPTETYWQTSVCCPRSFWIQRNAINLWWWIADVGFKRTRTIFAEFRVLSSDASDKVKKKSKITFIKNRLTQCLPNTATEVPAEICFS